MHDVNGTDLAQRLSNCLETILELEPKLRRLEMGRVLLNEFNLLKDFLLKVETFKLAEADVERIERATANFLRELEQPLGNMGRAARSHPLQ